MYSIDLYLIMRPLLSMDLLSMDDVLKDLRVGLVSILVLGVGCG